MRGDVSLPRLIFIGLLPMILIDAINGWLVSSFSVSVSLTQVYKVSFLLLIVLWLARYWQGGFYLVCAYITLSIFILFYHANDYISIGDINSDFGFSLKLGTAFIFYLFLRGYFNSVDDLSWTENWFWRIAYFSYFVLAMNIVLGFLGFGFSTAHIGAAGYGALGYFKAGNDVSATFLVISGLLLYRLWSLDKTWLYYVFGTITLVLALFLQTKTVIAGIGIILYAMPFIVAGSQPLRGRIRLRYIFLQVVIAIIVIVSIVWMIQNNAGIVQRFSYFYHKKGLLFATLMGRNYFYDLAAEVTARYSTVADVMLGHGWDSYLRKMGSMYLKDKLVEIDYVDIFMINGAVGLAAVLAIWIWLLAQAGRMARFQTSWRLVFFMDLLLLGIAGTAGHVLYSGMNGPFIAMLNAYPLLSQRHETDGGTD